MSIVEGEIIDAEIVDPPEEILLAEVTQKESLIANLIKTLEENQEKTLDQELGLQMLRDYEGYPREFKIREQTKTIFDIGGAMVRENRQGEWVIENLRGIYKWND